KDEVTVTLIGKFEDLCTIEVSNALGVKVISTLLNCKDAVTKIDVSKLTPGAYTIKVIAENKYHVHSKLVIIR
ncbi:MAG TPA: T9SS type A sorting domain-containing protein, partial [Bacteroidia bacterium]|nr:T9SS type A sorting domain-containing protein [Bacteroidia bacterium]